MSFEYVKKSGAPTMWPRILSGEGTVAEAGRWSTRSVRKKGCVVYSLIFFPYASSLVCARKPEAHKLIDKKASNRVPRPNTRNEFISSSLFLKPGNRLLVRRAARNTRFTIQPRSRAQEPG